jgi:hypothetical protein
MKWCIKQAGWRIGLSWNASFVGLAGLSKQAELKK